MAEGEDIAFAFCALRVKEVLLFIGFLPGVAFSVLSNGDSPSFIGVVISDFYHK